MQIQQYHLRMACSIAVTVYENRYLSCAQITVATAIKPYSEAVYAYASEDIIDNKWNYSTEAVGTPTLNLTDIDDRSKQFVANYVGMSNVQWLEVLEGDDTIDSAVGSHVLSYNGAETTCLEWNSIAQLRYALNGLSSLSGSPRKCAENMRKQEDGSINSHLVGERPRGS